MSRERLSWNRTARRHRTADPYQMNVERHDPSAEEYMTGDPSEWAEDPVEDLDYMDGTDRDEIGLPEEEWDSQVEAQERLASMQRYYEKKALHCIRIARALFPTASDDVIQEQALDFMPLPDDAVIATAYRLAEADEEAEDASEEAEEAAEEEKEGKKSSLSPDEMLRRMLAAEDAEETDEDEAKDASDEDADADEDDAEATEDKESKKAALMARARRLIAQAAELDAEDEKAEEKAEAKKDADADEKADDKSEEDEKAKEANMLADLMADMDDDDDLDDLLEDDDDLDDLDDVDVLMAEMEDDMDDAAELGIDLTPNLDHLDAAALLEQSDADLFRLMNRQQVEASQKTPSVRGVQQIGRVKEAGSKGVDLSKLWKHAPDVSSAFE